MSSAGDAPPIGPEEARHLFAALEDARGVLVAVSGGPDSMALLGLLAEWAANAQPGAARPALHAATVDHRLREASRAEADAVARHSARLGVPHAVLDWAGPKPDTGLQDAARQARYRLLFEEARHLAASHIVTAHHADDQAETVLMRLLHGSGIDGLAGMAPLRGHGSLVIARPLLGVSKARLVATAEAHGLPYVHDPSNEDPRYGRTRVRRLAAVLAREGLGTGQFTTLARRAARANAALDAAAEHAFVAFACGSEPGLRLGAGLFGEPAEIVLRVLVKAVGAIAARVNGGNAGSVRLERAERLAAELATAVAGKKALTRTLAGCVVSVDRLGEVTITREKIRTRGSALFTSRKRRTDTV